MFKGQSLVLSFGNYTFDLYVTIKSVAVKGKKLNKVIRVMNVELIFAHCTEKLLKQVFAKIASVFRPKEIPFSNKFD